MPHDGAHILMQAAMARLGARLGSGLVDAAANLALVVQDALKKCARSCDSSGRRWNWRPAAWSGMVRAVRLALPPPPWIQIALAMVSPHPAAAVPGLSVQEQIDALRAQVAGLGQRLDRHP